MEHDLILKNGVEKVLHFFHPISCFAAIDKERKINR